MSAHPVDRPVKVFEGDAAKASAQVLDSEVRESEGGVAVAGEQRGGALEQTPLGAAQHDDPGMGSCL
jgi:hypothetical protein